MLLFSKMDLVILLVEMNQPKSIMMSSSLCFFHRTFTNTVQVQWYILPNLQKFMILKQYNSIGVLQKSIDIFIFKT